MTDLFRSLNIKYVHGRSLV